MKIIQTFWSGKQPASDPTTMDLPGGWLSSEYHWMSWAYSCLQLRKFYEKVELITDEVGKSILVDRLGLPYTSVSTALENSPLKTMPSQLWAMAKVYSYGLQDKPFLHVDGDVFIAAPLDPSIINAPVVVQNLDINLDVYHTSLNGINQHFSFIPLSIETDRRIRNEILAYNAGVLGGNDIAFLQHYAHESYDFIERNVRHLSQVLIDPCFNMIPEQYLLFCLAQQNQVSVHCLFKEPVTTPTDFNRFIQFESFPQTIKYLHVMGAAKKQETVCRMLANLLRQQYPEFYYNILKHCRAAQVKLNHRAYGLPVLDPQLHSAEYFQQIKAYFNASDKVSLKIFLPTIKTQSAIDIIPNMFPQTRALLAQVAGFEGTEIIVEDAITSTRNVLATCIQQLVTPEYQLFLKDILCYEIRKNMCTQKAMPYAWLYAKDIVVEEQRSKWNLLNINELLDIYLVRDKHVSIIRTRWDWAPPADGTSSLEKWQQLLTQPPQVCYIALLPNIRTLAVDEMLLDDFDCLLLSLCNTAQSIRDILQMVSEYFSSAEIVADYSAFEEMVLLSLHRTLVYGLLLISPVNG